MGTGSLTFDEQAHEYHIGERRLPSVTQVLKLAGIIDATWYTEYGRDRGTFAHQAIEFSDRGELDEATLDPALMPYCNAWEKFLRESRAEVIYIEHRVCNDVHGYAGTIDRIMLINGAWVVVDIKTGSPEAWHALQTAAYARCIESPTLRMSVYLHDDGTYKAIAHTDRNDASVFLAAVAVANWKLNHGARV